MTEYGLLGQNIGYSLSPLIYKFYGIENYKIIDTLELDKALKKDFNFYNITTPYKVEAVKYIDILDAESKKLNAVNLAVKKDKIYGYNTDCYGFLCLLKKYKIKVKNKSVLILGSGGASQSVKYVLDRKKAKTTVVSRSGKVNYENVYSLYKDIDIIVNATPVGSKKVEGKPIDLEKFNKVKCVIDLIYSPLNTPLLLKAKELNIKSVNGLYMLCAQAQKTAEILGKASKDKTDEIYKYLLLNNYNIVLSGLSGVGKTTVGKALSEKLNKVFFDSDNEYEKQFNSSPKEDLENLGEATFRKRESEIIENISKNTNSIIATGGGAILNSSNRNLLRENSTTILIKRNLRNIDTSNRPLYKNKTVKQLYKERKEIYNSFSEYKIKNDGKIEKTVKRIERIFK